MSTAEHDRASTSFHMLAELNMAQICLLPAMASQGLQISAGGHTITLLPGRLVDRLADELAQQLRLEVLRREAEEFTRQGAPA